MTTTDPRRSASERPGLREMLEVIAPRLLFVPVAGPPVLFVLGPWLLLGLMLAGPLAWAFALVVVLIVAAAVLAALTAATFAILAAPYLLVRRLRRQRARHASVSAPAARVRVAA